MRKNTRKRDGEENESIIKLRRRIEEEENI